MTHGYIGKLKEKIADIENKIELYTGYLAFLESELAVAEKMYEDKED